MTYGTKNILPAGCAQEEIIKHLIKNGDYTQISRIATEEEREIDLRVYPVNAHQVDLSHTKTYGDMHGNTMKVLWSFIDCGAAIMTPADFQAMWAIYDTYWYYVDSQEVKIALADFEQLLTRITFIPGANIRFLGDMMADRGDCDYLTLKILAKAITDKVNVEILLSNHDSTLLMNYANLLGGNLICVSSPCTSFETLFRLVKAKLITQEEVKQLVEICYFSQKSLKLVSYCLSEDKQKIAIFMHAPNYFEIIYTLADQFKCVYAERDNAQALAQLIDQINAKFYRLTVEQRIGLIKDASGERLVKAIKNSAIAKANPLAMVMYNANAHFFHVPVIKDYWPLFLSGVFHGHVSIDAKDIVNIYDMIPNYLTLLNMLHCYDDSVGKYDRMAAYQTVMLATKYRRIVILKSGVVYTNDRLKELLKSEDFALQQGNGRLTIYRNRNKGAGLFRHSDHITTEAADIIALVQATGIKFNSEDILYTNTNQGLLEELALKFNFIVNKKALVEHQATKFMGSSSTVPQSHPVILFDYSSYLIQDYDQNMSNEQWRQLIQADLTSQQISADAYVYKYNTQHQTLSCLHICDGVIDEEIKSIAASKEGKLVEIISSLKMQQQVFNQHQQLNSQAINGLMLGTTSGAILVKVYYMGQEYDMTLRNYQCIRNIIDNNKIYAQNLLKTTDGNLVFFVDLAAIDKAKSELEYLIEKFLAVSSNKGVLLSLSTQENLGPKQVFQLIPEPDQIISVVMRQELAPEVEQNIMVIPDFKIQ